MFEELDRLWRERRLSLVADLTAGNLHEGECLHFPDNDFHDPVTGAQFFLHRHHAKDIGLTTHIHIFQRWESNDLKHHGIDGVVTHLAALQLNEEGEPEAWLSLNQWVTGEHWIPAEQTISCFDGWHFSRDYRRSLNGLGFWCEWLSHLIALELHTTIRALLDERDAKLDMALEQSPSINVLQDRALEVVARREILTKPSVL